VNDEKERFLNQQVSELKWMAHTNDYSPHSQTNKQTRAGSVSVFYVDIGIIDPGLKQTMKHLV